MQVSLGVRKSGQGLAEGVVGGIWDPVSAWRSERDSSGGFCEESTTTVGGTDCCESPCLSASPSPFGCISST